MCTFVVLVLGDVGRSPRMMYHAQSLLRHARCVHLVGYYESAILPALAQSPKVHQCALWSAPLRALNVAPFVVRAPLKALYIALVLLWTLLFRVSWRVDAFLVQNPPAVPALFIAGVAAAVRRARLVVDWHNYGHTMLQHALRGRCAALVGAAAAYERVCARTLAHAHLCVTRAMRDDLRRRVGLSDVHVLYDRPQRAAGETSARDAHALFVSLRSALEAVVDGYDAAGDATPWTVAGEWRAKHWLASNGSGRNDRRRQQSSSSPPPPILVSSTSWTDDEDFSMLVDALRLYERRAAPRRTAAAAPLLIITGKADGGSACRRRFDDALRAARLRRVRVVTLWLPSLADYARLLGAATLAICMHASTSGLDLPMKVVDAHGARLPAAALDFSALRELVTDDNGWRFDDADALAALLLRLLGDEARGTAEIARKREHLRAHPGEDWATHWRRNARDVIVGGRH